MYVCIIVKSYSVRLSNRTKRFVRRTVVACFVTQVKLHNYVRCVVQLTVCLLVSVFLFASSPSSTSLPPQSLFLCPPVFYVCAYLSFISVID